MTIRRTWALGVLPGASNPTFPVRGIILQHLRWEFYFDVVHVQVSKNPEQWYYISNERKPAGVYMFNRSGRIHAALPGVNYGGDAGLPFVVPGLMHERGHNIRGEHSSDNRDLMRPSLMMYGLPTLNDYNRYFRGFPFKAGRPKPWDAGEKERWMVNPSMLGNYDPGEMYCEAHDDVYYGAELPDDEIPTQWIDDDTEALMAFAKDFYPNMGQ